MGERRVTHVRVSVERRSGSARRTGLQRRHGQRRLLQRRVLPDRRRRVVPTLY